MTVFPVPVARTTLAAAFVLAVQCSAPQRSHGHSCPPRAIHGQVVDPKGRPLAGVRYWVSGWQERAGDQWVRVHYLGLPLYRWTAGDGVFCIQALSNGRSDLDFDAPGCEPAFLRGLDPGTRHRLIVSPGLDLAGRVVRHHGPGQEPAADIAVTLTRPNPDGVWFQTRTFTDAAGSFRFPGFLSPSGSGGTATAWRLQCEGQELLLEYPPGQAVTELLLVLSTDSQECRPDELRPIGSM